MIRTVGFVGLGAMGLGMARNLLQAGFHVTGCDLQPDPRKAFQAAGGAVTEQLDTLLANPPDVLSLCLASGAQLKLCDAVLIERAPEGLTILDHSTIPAPETRRLHVAFAQRGVRYLDVPMSGGRGGAESGQLHLYVGAAREDCAECLPYFEAVAHPETIFFAGQPGQAQVMKCVQNMASWYLDAVRMEILAFGLHSGLTDQQLAQACKEAHQPGPFTNALARIRRGDTGFQVNLNAEYDYFLQEADANGFPMPMMRGLMDFLHTEPREATDVVHRPAHNTWQRFMRTCPAAADASNG
ncbi:MAG: NAD(P)-dependent oxidoreductase [Opitutales bacterium]